MAELKKSVGLRTIISITITSMIGTGFFFGAGIGAKYSGVSSIVAWLILGTIAIYVGMIFAELVALFPKAGGVYEYAKNTYGSFTSFLVGWITWIVTNVTTAVVIVAAYQYIMPVNACIGGISFFCLSWQTILSMLTILIFNYVVYKGNKGSSLLLGIFSLLSVIVLLAIFVPGLFNIDAANFTPFWAASSVGALAVTLFFIFETFMGWEAAGFLAEETRNPTKIIPKGIIISTILVVILGVGVTIVSLGVINWQDLQSSSTPLLLVAQVIYGKNAGIITSVGIFLTLLGSSFGAVVSSPRLLMALARDKLFIQQMEEVHPKYGSPFKAIWFQAIVSVLVVFLAFGQYRVLLELLVPMALIMYFFVVISVPILRKKMKHAQRDFKAPFGSFLPWIIGLMFISVIFAWLWTIPNSWSQFKIILSFIGFGIPIYFLLLFHYNDNAIRTLSDGMSRINLLFENFLLPRSVRVHILSHFRRLEGKTILEYGSGVGTLTMHLSEAVGKTGKVVAIDMSRKNLSLVTKRAKKAQRTNIECVFDPYLMNRVNPDIKHADIVFSVGMLSYIQNIPDFLESMKQIIPNNGGIVFVEYVDFFYIIPNLPWLSKNDKIEKIFRDSGFSVRVERRRSLFWRYVFVYGINSEEDVPFI